MSSTHAVLGSTGLAISRVGLGNWAIGGARGEWGWGAQDDDASIATILRAVELGVDWVDTAAAYGLGHAEEVLGRAIRLLPEGDRPLVFTKCGLEWDGTATRRVGRPDALKAGLELSRQRLGLPTIDVLQLHWPPEDGTDIRDAWSTLLAMRDAGDIRFAGVSNVTASQLRDLEAIGHVDVVQPPLSMLRRDAIEVIAAAAAAGSGVICYSPMQAGLLTGKHTAATIAALEPADWRRGDAFFREPLLSGALGLVDEIRPLADRSGMTLAELAVGWVLAQEGVTAAIAGARRPEQIDDWIGACRRTLDERTLAEVDDILIRTGAGTGPAPRSRRSA